MITSIDIQKEKLLKGNPIIDIVKPCRINDGINVVSPSEYIDYITIFNRTKEDLDIDFFIPASGSGSRMFGALFHYLNEDTSNTAIEFIEQFLNNIQKFAFYNKLPSTFKKEINKGTIDIDKLIKYILFDEGLNFGQLPKGLIPFHLYGKFIINPFQEQILHGTKVSGENVTFNFTINPSFEKQIKHTIKVLREITGVNFNYKFSIQNASTHSVAFDHKLKVLQDECGNPILRPSGHGALLENLNMINADLIFIKNIDNVQHYSQAKTGIESQKVLGGVLIEFKKDVNQLLQAIDAQSSQVEKRAFDINDKYKLQLNSNQLTDIEFLKTHFNRPIRVCGMVKNEGQAGGGPFWVRNEKGELTLQIVEKAQINSNQLSILLHATHFNPVVMVCSVKDYKNNKFDLKQFSNTGMYFIVNKTEKGKQIKYIENPGLWNGGMFNWLTLFYQIDSKCFSPVKTVLDLLKPLHLDKDAID